MNITFNKEPRQVAAGTVLSDFIANVEQEEPELAFGPRGICVYNGALCNGDITKTIVLAEGDIVTYMLWPEGG